MWTGEENGRGKIAFRQNETRWEMARVSGERWSRGGMAKATRWLELGKENKNFAVEKNETMKKNEKKNKQETN